MQRVKQIFSDKKVIILGVFVVFIFLMMDLNTRLSDLHRLSVQRDQMQTDVYKLEETKASLMKQLAYATSEVAVEEWARVYNRLAQPGDQIIIPLESGGITPTPVVLETPVARDVQKWEVWKALFFNE
jgi:hypothetical protein